MQSPGLVSSLECGSSCSVWAVRLKPDVCWMHASGTSRYTWVAVLSVFLCMLSNEDSISPPPPSSSSLKFLKHYLLRCLRHIDPTFGIFVCLPWISEFRDWRLPQLQSSPRPRPMLTKLPRLRSSAQTMNSSGAGKITLSSKSPRFELESKHYQGLHAASSDAQEVLTSALSKPLSHPRNSKSFTHGRSSKSGSRTKSKSKSKGCSSDHFAKWCRFCDICGKSHFEW